MDLSKFDWKFKIFGTPVRVMVSFWLICVFFSPFTQGQEGPWLFGLLGWSAAVFLSFMAHELGHAFAMRKLYGSQPTIDLGIGRTASGSPVFGGLTTSYARNTTPSKRAMTALAGPLTEIAAAVALILVLTALGMQFRIVREFGFLPLPLPVGDSFRFAGPAVTYFTFFFVYGFAWIGIVWGLFNLAPIYPCDGGQIMLAVFAQTYGVRGIKMTLVVSIVCALVLAALFAYDRNVFMAFFCGFSAYQNYRLLQSQGRL